MEKLLAIDCATETASVALAVGNDFTFDVSLEQRGNAKALLPMVEKLLREANIALVEIEGLCITIGPGSFTGIRIGIALVQGLMYSVKMPVYPFDSLEVMAFSVSDELQSSSDKSSNPERLPTILAPAINARMEEVYWAKYPLDNTGLLLNQQAAPSIIGKADFAREVQLLAQQNLMAVVGDAYDMEGLDFSGIALRNLHPPSVPRALSMIELLRKSPLKRKALTDASLLQPLYLRNEVTWKKRTRIRQ